MGNVIVQETNAKHFHQPALIGQQKQFITLFNTPTVFQFLNLLFNLVNWQNLIKKALKHVESHTCMRFQERSDGKDYLQFIRGSGCYSSVGRVGGRQQVSIGYGCDSVKNFNYYYLFRSELYLMRLCTLLAYGMNNHVRTATIMFQFFLIMLIL